MPRLPQRLKLLQRPRHLLLSNSVVIPYQSPRSVLVSGIFLCHSTTVPLLTPESASEPTMPKQLRLKMRMPRARLTPRPATRGRPISAAATPQTLSLAASSTFLQSATSCLMQSHWQGRCPAGSRLLRRSACRTERGQRRPSAARRQGLQRRCKLYAEADDQIGHRETVEVLPDVNYRALVVITC